MNNDDIKVSVIIPIYNACDYLAPALDSVLGQTLSDIEIICVDDGSTDHSLEIIKEYQRQDPRIRIITETNAGPAFARNNGVRRARGEYVAFLDADDFFAPRLLEELYTASKKNELDIAIAGYDIYNSRRSRFEAPPPEDNSDIFTDGKVTSKNEHPDRILTSTVGAAWNKLFRRSFIVEKNLSFLADAKMYEDVYFVTTALSLAERVGKVSEILMHHRIHSEQSRVKLFRKYYPQVPDVYLKIKDFLVQHGMYAPLSLSYLNLSAGRCYKVFNVLPQDDKEKFWNMLNSKYAELFGWHSNNPSDFQSDEVREFAVCVQLYSFDQYRKRCSKGARVKTDGIQQGIQKVKKRRKLRSLFAKMFSSNS